MERLELYKGFRLRAYEDSSGQWLAEGRKFPNTDWIATPSGHPTPDAAIAFRKADDRHRDRDNQSANSIALLKNCIACSCHSAASAI